VKSLGPRHFSWIAFVASQVVIDCEPLYYMLQREFPVHRTLHTFVGATLAGIATALAMIGLKTLLAKTPTTELWSGWLKSLRYETSTSGILAGAILGGLSHPFLDGIMHSDIKPFAPWSDSNYLLRVIDVGLLHLLCFLSGTLGAAILVWEQFKRSESK
jgi:hypothetical protein